MFNREYRGLHAAAQLQFLENALYMNLDGAFRHVQVARDVELVAQALGDTQDVCSRGVSLPSAVSSAAGVVERS